MKHLLSALIILLCPALYICAQGLNPDFGKSGRSIINFFERTNDDYNAQSIGFTNDHRIVLGGDIYYEGMVHRMNRNGSDDTLFASKGFSFFDFGMRFNNRIEETLTYPDGSILAIGHETPNISLSNRYSITSSAILVKLLPNGDPDPAFGIRGKAMYIHPYVSIWAYTGAVQPDGKIVVACKGHTDVTATAVWDRILLVRFTAQGRIDSSFGTNGGFVIPNFNTWSYYYSGDMGLAIQPDGKIILGDVYSETPFVSGGKALPAVYRVTTKGRLDSSFAINGKFANQFGFFNYAINSLLVQPDGKITVAGNTISSTNTSTLLMFRLKTSGEVDSSFATNGVFTYTRTGWLEPAIGQIQMQGTDKIVASASHNTSVQGVLDVFRMKLNGTFDSTFAPGAVIFQRNSQSGHFFNFAKLAMDTAGEIAAIGYSTFSPYRNFSNKSYVIARLTKDGTLNPEFNTSGFKIYYGSQNITNISDYNFGSSDRFGGIARLSSGKIMLAGTSYRNNETKKEVGLTRLMPNGKIDSSFATNGRKTYPEIPSFTRIRAFIQLNDEKMLMNINEKTVMKVDSTGTPDPTFGTNGLYAHTLPNINGFNPTIKGLAQQSDGKIIILTETKLLRLNTNGTVDNGFGTNGVVTMNFNFAMEAKVVKVQPDGKIVVGAEAGTNFLFRCSASGIPDNSFGIFGNGYANVHVAISPSFESGFNARFIDFEFQPDGKIVVLAMKDKSPGVPNISPLPNYRDIILFRLTANGLIDNSFGGYPDPLAYQGTSHLALPFSEEVPGDLMLTPDGKLLIAAYLSNGLGWDAGLVQLKANGKFDTTCTIRGFTTAGLDNVVQNRSFEKDLPMKVIPGDNGTYLVAGTQMGQNLDFFVANFMSPSSPMATYAAFSAVKDTACLRVNLNWQTDYECGIDSFYVEYSTNNIDFTRIGRVRATGNPAPLNNYLFVHNGASYGTNFYRLRLFTNGSNYSTSAVQQVNIPNLTLSSIIWDDIIKFERDTVFDAELHWHTLFENGSRNFELQISTDSVNFQTVRVVTAAGTSSTTRQYSVTITGLPAGKYYFRIRLLGDDCREIMSAIKAIELEKGCANQFRIAPNPVHTLLKVKIPECEKGELRIVNVLGQVLQIIKNVNQPEVTIDCSRLPAATYFIQFFGRETYAAKFIRL